MDKQSNNDGTQTVSIKPEDVKLIAQGLLELGKKLVPVTQRISKSINQFYKSHEKEFLALGEVLMQFGSHVYVYNEFHQNCRKHDIIPHVQLYKIFQGYPLFFQMDSDKQLDFLRKEWPILKGKLLESYPTINENTSRLDFFRELLEAHEKGLYKIANRVAIIEIEGLASDFCKKNETADNINKRKNLIQNWAKNIDSSRAVFSEVQFIVLSFENFSHNIFKSSNSKSFDSGLSQSDLLLSRNFHAHGFIDEVSERQSLNAILLLHNMAKYFHIIDEFDTISDI